MKVYFKKTGGVIRVRDERDGKPYCSTTEYRKNFSELNRTEREEYNQFLIDEAQKEDWRKEPCGVCGKVQCVCGCKPYFLEEDEEEDR